MNSHLIRQMGYLLLQVPDPQETARDLADIIGVRIASQGSDHAYVTSNSRACEVAFLKGGEAGVRVIGLEAMDAASVEEAKRRVSAKGFAVLSDKPSLAGVERAFRFGTPFGPVFEIHTPIARDQPERYAGTTTRLKRFEHINMKVEDPHALYGLLCDCLGMRLSDRDGDLDAAWYRAWDGYHHTIAAGKGNKLHHYAFKAPAMDDLVALADTLDIRGRDLLWGPGRHGAGNNVFTYYLDPNGCVVETSIDMARIENDDTYVMTDWTKERAGRQRNRWGAASPPEYFKGGLPYLRP